MKASIFPSVCLAFAVTSIKVASGWAPARVVPTTPFGTCQSTRNLLPMQLQSSLLSSPVILPASQGLRMADSSTDSSKKSRKTLDVLKSITVLSIVCGVILWKRHALLSSIHFIKDEWLMTTLDRLSAAGPIGLLVYTVAFLVWEMTFGMTTPVETTAGIAFGAVPAIVASGSAKFTGALLTFLLARYRFKERVQQKMKGNEVLELMEESVQETPFRVALLCRFAPLPEFVKNAGMGILPVPRRWFIASLLVHGFSFTCLWSCMGAETARVLRGLPPSSTLKYLITGATWIGFGAPVGIALWIKSLKDKQRNRLLMMAEKVTTEQEIESMTDSKIDKE